MEALPHPEDFDGIAAGAPVLDWTVQNTFHHAWTVQRNRSTDGSAAITADRLPVLRRLVLAACGGSGKDGVVADPLRCAFDPARAVCAPGADPAICLTEEEARAAAAIYDGPRTAATGERLIVWHRLADQDIAPRTTLAWWHAPRRDQGAARVDASARLYLVPGLAHCAGGAGGLTELDTLTPLLRWVEEGIAPGDLAGRVVPTGDWAPEPFLGAERFGPRR